MSRSVSPSRRPLLRAAFILSETRFTFSFLMSWRIRFVWWLVDLPNTGVSFLVSSLVTIAATILFVSTCVLASCFGLHWSVVTGSVMFSRSDSISLERILEWSKRDISIVNHFFNGVFFWRALLNATDHAGSLNCFVFSFPRLDSLWEHQNPSVWRKRVDSLGWTIDPRGKVHSCFNRLSCLRLLLHRDESTLCLAANQSGSMFFGQVCSHNWKALSQTIMAWKLIYILLRSSKRTSIASSLFDWALHTGNPEHASKYHQAMLKYCSQRNMLDCIAQLNKTYHTKSQEDVRAILTKWDDDQGRAMQFFETRQ